MEENKDQKAVEAEVIKEGNSSTNQTNKVVEFIKAKKMIIGIALIAIILIIVIANLIIVSPKEAVKNFVKAFSSADVNEMFDTMNLAGVYVFGTLDEDDYDDFWSEYKDFIDSSDYEDYMDEMNDTLDDEDAIDEINGILEDLDVTMEVDEFKKVKKEASHLYLVELKLRVESNDMEVTMPVECYVMKEGTKSYVLDIYNDDGESLLNSIY